jgi:hypothetical protein
MGRLVPCFIHRYPEGQFAGPWWRTSGIGDAECDGAWRGIGQPSFADSKINEAHPGTNDLTNGTWYPTWNTGWGWNFAFVSGFLHQYLNTGLVIVDGNRSLLARFSDAVWPSTASTLCGVRTNITKGVRFYLMPWASSGTGTHVYGNANSLTQSPGLAAGHMGFAGGEGFLDGVSEGTFSNAFEIPGTRAMIIGGMNYGGSNTYYYEGRIQAVAVYNVILSTPQYVAIYNQMMALA